MRMGLFKDYVSQTRKPLADGDGECNYWIFGDKDPDALADVGSK